MSHTQLSSATERLQRLPPAIYAIIAASWHPRPLTISCTVVFYDTMLLISLPAHDATTHQTTVEYRIRSTMVVGKGIYFLRAAMMENGQQSGVPAVAIGSGDKLGRTEERTDARCVLHHSVHRLDVLVVVFRRHSQCPTLSRSQRGSRQETK